MNPRDLVAATLPKKMSQTRRDELAEEILDTLATHGYLVDGDCNLVEVATAMVPVQTIEAYGLTLSIDANGEASEISHRDGLVVLG